MQCSPFSSLPLVRPFRSLMLAGLLNTSLGGTRRRFEQTSLQIVSDLREGSSLKSQQLSFTSTLSLGLEGGP